MTRLELNRSNGHVKKQNALCLLESISAKEGFIKTKFKITLSLALAACAAGAVAGGCSKKKDAKKATVRLNAVSQVTASSLDDLGPMATGGSGTSGVASLKYLITGISLCEGLTPQGSGFSNLSNCASIYNGGDFSAFQYTTITLNQVLAVQNGEYASQQIDLMDATSRAKLNVSGSVPVGTIPPRKPRMICESLPRRTP